MGLPIVTLSRLIDRKQFRSLPAGVAWRLPATVLLLALVLPVLLAAAVATLPVVLTAGLAVGLRRAWQRQAQRLHARGDRPRR
ncbi:hypothetical protein [Piscinibacter defluvii]|uniref:hypothetical protein n=1 Tax=Piscinibacter defluvii TaxID=1796922 RepID=UPI000FDEEDFC|nr:hypothetical protein [Piscinibacter defluvii]